MLTQSMPGFIYRLTHDRKLAEAYRLAAIALDAHARESERQAATKEALALLAQIPNAND